MQTAQYPTASELTYLLTAIDTLVSTVAPVLLPIAASWGRSLAVIGLIVILFRAMLGFLSGQMATSVAEIILYLLRIIVVEFLLHFYALPIPGLGVSISTFFQSVAVEIAQIIDVSGLDQLLTLISNAVQGMQQPNFLDFFSMILYYIVLFGTSILDGALLMVTAVGFFAVALGEVFGPIFIVLYLLPWGRTEEKFWGWVNFMWTYSMYRAVAAAFVFTVTLFLSNFFQNALNGNYTLGHLFPLALFMISSIFVVVFGAFKVPGWTAELFGSVGHVGSGFENFVRNTVFLFAA